MNKLKYIFILFICTIFLTGCNYQVIDMEYNYNKIVCNYNGDSFELEIDKWTDYDGEQIQVISNGKTYLLSANCCYMIRG